MNANVKNEQTAEYCDPARRHDFVLLFDVTDGNPNGDPDAGNIPRVDPETMQGLVTDVCLKRKVRNFVATTNPGDTAPNRIYVQDRGAYLNDLHLEAHKAVKIESDHKNPPRDKRDKARDWMCENFYDIRMFGAVMGTNVNAGQVRGPVQLTFARSHDAIVPLDVSITRIALTSDKEKAAGDTGSEDSEGGSRSGTMGRKALVPYGLYRAHGFFSAPLARKTGVIAEDLQTFWRALVNMWDLDRSAARGLMACRGLYVFTHENAFGNAPAHELFELCRVTRRPEVAAPRAYKDYEVSIDEAMPAGVCLTRLVG